MRIGNTDQQLSKHHGVALAEAEVAIQEEDQIVVEEEEAGEAEEAEEEEDLLIEDIDLSKRSILF